MKNLKTSLAIGACVALSSAGAALATGQPGTNSNVNCGMTPATSMTPGGSGSTSNTGSPFSGGTSGNVYANAFNGTGSQATTNTNATSQYDIACKNFTTAKTKQLH